MTTGTNRAAELVSGNDATAVNGPITFSRSKWGGQSNNFFSASSQAFTISRVINPAKFTLVAYGIQTGSSSAIIVAGNAGVTQLSFYLTDSKVGFTSAPSTFQEVTWSTPTNSTWHQFAGTYDGATLTGYIDGAAINSAAKSGTPSATAASDFAIGRFGASTTNFWNGGLEALRIYDRALSQAEIQWLNVEPYAGTYAANAYIVGNSATNATVNLNGASATAAVGSFGYISDDAIGLVGAQANAAAGSFAVSYSNSVALAGVGTFASAGAFTPSVSSVTALTGVSATADIGVLTPSSYVDLFVPIITIMNANPIPLDGEMVDDDVPVEADMPIQIAFEAVLNTNPIPMTGTLSAVPVPGEGSVP